MPDETLVDQEPQIGLSPAYRARMAAQKLGIPWTQDMRVLSDDENQAEVRAAQQQAKGVEAGKGAMGEVRAGASALKENAIPGVLSALGGAAALALAPETAGASMLVPLAVGLGGGAAGGYAGSKIQEAAKAKLMTPQEQADQQAYESGLYQDNKIGTTIGSTIPSLIAFRPSLQNLGNVTKAATKTIASLPVNVQEADAVKNTLLSGSISGGQNIAEQSYRLGTGEQQNFDPASLAESVVTGGLLSEPTKLATTLSGGHLQPSVPNDVMEAKVRPGLTPNSREVGETGEIVQESALNDYMKSLYKRANAKQLGEFAAYRAELGKAPLEPEKASDAELHEGAQQLADFLNNSKAPFLTPEESAQRQADFEKARAEEAGISSEDLIARFNQQDNAKIAARLQKAMSENIIQPKDNLTSVGEAPEDANTKYQPSDSLTSVMSPQERIEWLRRAQQEGAHFGADVVQGTQAPTNEANEPQRAEIRFGQGGQRSRVVLSPGLDVPGGKIGAWTPDSPYHELVHQYVLNLSNSSNPKDIALANKSLDIIKKAPEAQQFLRDYLDANPGKNLNDAADEYLANIGGKQYASIMEREIAKPGVGKKVVQYLKDVANNWKAKYGDTTPENMARYLVEHGRSRTAFDYDSSLNARFKGESGGSVGGRNQPLESSIDDKRPFITSAERELSQPRPFGLTPSKEGNIPVASLVSRSAIIPKGELGILQEAGLGKFLEGKTSVNVGELKKWIQENGPSVKVETYGQKGKVSDARAEFDKLSHEWYDNLSIGQKEMVAAYGEASFNNSQLPMLPKGMEDSVKKYLALKSVVAAEDRNPVISGPRATSAYNQVSPKSTSTHPVERVDVTIPAQTEAGKKYPKWSPDNLHENLPNTLGWAATQPEIGVNGERISHIFEAQSRWAQEARKIRQGDLESMDWNEMVKGSHQHPLLDYHQNLILKAAIQRAIAEGKTHIALSDAETAMMTEGHDQYHGDFERGTNRPSQERGMRLHYDEVMPNILEKLTGYKGEVVNLGEHKNAFIDTVHQGHDHEPRENLIFKNPDGSPKTSVTARLYPLDKVKARLENERMTLMGKFQPIEKGEVPTPVQEHTDLSTVENQPRERDSVVDRPLDKIADIYNRNKMNPFTRFMAPIYDKMREKGLTTDKSVPKDIAEARAKNANYAADAGVATETETTRNMGKLNEPFLMDVEKAGLSQREEAILGEYAWDMRHTGESPLANIVESNPRMIFEYNSGRGALLKTHEIQREQGQKVGEREARDIPNYHPDVISHEARNLITKDPTNQKSIDIMNDIAEFWASKMKGKDKTANLEEAKGWAEDYRKALSQQYANAEHVDFAALDRAEGFGLPKSAVEKSYSNAINRYLTRASRGLAYFKYVENDPHMRSLLNIPDKKGSKDSNLPYLPDGTPINENTNPIAGTTAESFLKSFRRSMTDADAITNTVNKGVLSGWLGALTGSKYLLSTLSTTYPYLKYHQLYMYGTALKDLSEATKQSYYYGVNSVKPMRLKYAMDTVTGVLSHVNSLTDMISKVGFANKIENFYRSVNMAIGYNVARAMVNSKPDAASRRFLRIFGQHVEGGAEQYRGQGTNVPEHVLWEMAAQFVERNQGTYTGRDLPEGAISGRFSPLLSLARYSISRLNNEYKDVYLPLKLEGDPNPMIKRFLSGLVGGSAIIGLIQAATGRKQEQPTIREAFDSKNVDQKFYAVANTLAMSDYFGIAGDNIAGALDVMNGHRGASSLVFPAVDFQQNTLGPLVADYINAMKQNADPVDTTLQFLKDFTHQTFQSYRLVANHLDQQYIEQNKQGNEKRDWNVYKRLQGYPPTEDQSGGSNRLLTPAIKRFNLTDDPAVAQQEVGKAIEEAVRTSGGKTDLVVNKLNQLFHQHEDMIPTPSTAEKVKLLYGFRDWYIKQHGPSEFDRLLSDMTGRQIVGAKAGEAAWDAFANDYKRKVGVDALKENLVARTLASKAPQLSEAFQQLRMQDQANQ